VSALKLRATGWAPDRVHVAWGFAKDFGLSGFRTGFVISKSEYVKNAMLGGQQLKSLSWFTPFDSLKHLYIEQIIKEEEEKPKIWDGAMSHYKAHLAESFREVAGALKSHGIKFVHPETGNSAQFYMELFPFGAR